MCHSTISFFSPQDCLLANFVPSAATFLPLPPPPPPIVGKIAKEGRKTQRSLVRREGRRERDSLSSALSPLPTFSEDISCLGEESMSVSVFFSSFWPRGVGGRTSQMCLRLKKRLRWGNRECGALNLANAFSPSLPAVSALAPLLSFPRRRWNRRHSQLGFVTLNAP